eukprot:937362-Pyramimonas_sp.AAC.1
MLCGCKQRTCASRPAWFREAIGASHVQSRLGDPSWEPAAPAPPSASRASLRRARARFGRQVGSRADCRAML